MFQCNIRIAGIDRYNVVGFVGPLSNEDTMAAASLTSDMDLTLISPSADSVLLSNYEQYPFFLRTTPTIQVDIDVIAAVLDEVDTKYVAAIYEEVSTNKWRWQSLRQTVACPLLIA